MKKLINYLRSCLCKHEWDKIESISIYTKKYDYPTKRINIYTCKKCGCIKKVKM